ncbi:MAG TPA: hypothetical protein VLF62_01915 [Candidatus Saccharimonadales bacterium]|nr:hypothetical protein [Candidatus Saccharimonadales bacterium]
MTTSAEDYIRVGVDIELTETTRILPQLERLTADVLPVDDATVQREQQPVAEDEQGPYWPTDWTHSFGPIDVTRALAEAVHAPLDVVKEPLGGAATEPTRLTQAAVTVVSRKTTKVRIPSTGILQLDTVADHTITVYDTSVEPPRVHATYDSIPVETNYPATADGKHMGAGTMHVDALALGHRALEFPVILAEQRARLSWLTLLDRPQDAS